MGGLLCRRVILVMALALHQQLGVLLQTCPYPSKGPLKQMLFALTVLGRSFSSRLKASFELLHLNQCSEVHVLLFLSVNQSVGELHIRSGTWTGRVSLDSGCFVVWPQWPQNC